MTLILPFALGGPVDVLGRLLAQEYQARSGPVAGVENRRFLLRCATSNTLQDCVADATFGEKSR
jgi:hypothetical protein